MNLDEYAKGGRALYSKFASVVAEIIEPAVKADAQIRLQHIQRRAKGVGSLRKKLQGLGQENTEDLAAAVKDLAGCRVILYTNSDSVYLGSNPSPSHHFVPRNCGVFVSAALAFGQRYVRSIALLLTGGTQPHWN